MWKRAGARTGAFLSLGWGRNAMRQAVGRACETLGRGRRGEGWGLIGFVDVIDEEAEEAEFFAHWGENQTGHVSEVGVVFFLWEG